MKKKVILVLIILIPSLIYFFFELSEVNFKKMAYYGPKTLDVKGDTVYYTIPESAENFGYLYKDNNIDTVNGSTTSYMVGDTAYTNEGAKVFLFFDRNQQTKLAGLLEFEKYKKEKLDFLKVILVHIPASVPEEGSDYYRKYLNDSLGIRMNNFFLTTTIQGEFDFEKIRANYFLNKPIHVFNYFAVLVDKDRHIRGYYDPTYISEVKRMIEEYKHLVLKDEHANMQDVNQIEKK